MADTIKEKFVPQMLNFQWNVGAGYDLLGRGYSTKKCGGKIAGERYVKSHSA